MGIVTREMRQSDVSEACALLNDLIRVGGTTAFETEFDDVGFGLEFLTHINLICSHVALDDQGKVAGFQSLWHSVDLGPAGADIATFARRAPVLRGVGAVLFDDSTAFARARGLELINATIRADNVQGLGYYTKMGFLDYSTAHAVPLQDGTLVDRISKCFYLT